MPSGREQWWVSAIVAGWLAIVSQSAAADPPKLTGESPRTAQRFVDAAAFEKDQRWTDAIELYLRLLDDAGNDLVPADDDPRHLLPARDLVHRRVAARPELLAPYRARVEPRAKRLLEQGEASGDVQPLEQIVDQFFCSRSAETALHRLGDLACEHGDFEAARRYWRLLEPADSARSLAYPDPQAGPALARAKQAVAFLLAGDRPAAAAAIQAFRKTHADAAGHLAGRDGNLATTLQHLLDTADLVRVPAAEIALAPTTFAIDATRNGVLPGVLPPFAPEPRYPPIILPGGEDRHGVQHKQVRPAALAFHPLIARGQIFVANGRHVLAYDLATGKRSGAFDLLPSGEEVPSWATTKLPLNSGGAFTLTADGDRLFARLGPPTIKATRGEAASVLVCLQWRPDAATPAERLRSRWSIAPPKAGPADAVATWEGSPVVRDGRLFAAFTRLDGTRAVTTIGCFDADDPSTGPIWRSDVYEAAAETADRARPHLLTLAGQHVVLGSHAGVIVALDAASGRRAWAVRYPPRESGPTGNETGPRDPAPCVAAGGRLYVAPADAGRVICLDAASGSSVWTSDPLDVAHLLGVVGDRVICTLGGFHAGLCALDAATGRRLPDWGYRVAGADALAPFGRGLLCRDRVYWPTRAAGVQMLRMDGTTGYPPTSFRDLPGGNLTYGDGSLVVATADRLHVLVGTPVEVAGPAHRVGKVSDHRHDLLLWQADMLRRTGRPAADVRAALDAAAEREFSPERRAVALVRRAEFDESVGGSGVARRAITSSEELRRVSLRGGDGRIWSAQAWADERTDGVARPESAKGVAVDQSRPRPSQTQGVPPSDNDLRLPLEPAWQISLDRGREWALLPEDGNDVGRVYVAGRDWLACRSASDGVDRWRRELEFAPTWLVLANGSVIVAGADGAARLGVTDGKVVWQFRVPASVPWFDRPGWLDTEAIWARERLTGFRWAAGRLFAMLGSGLLIALDGTTGRVAWQHSAPFAGAFQPNYFADSRHVVAQTAAGRRWILDAATGSVLQTGPAPEEPWPNSPIALDDRRLLVVEDGKLVVLDRSAWTTAWTWDLPRWPSLTGNLPQTRLVSGMLLVGVPRNDCTEIERLEPATGRPLSSRPVCMARGSVDLAGAAADGGLLHLVVDGELRSIECDRGRIMDRRTLQPTARWRVEPAVDGLLLWTVPTASPFEPPGRCGILMIDRSEPERQRGKESSLALGLGPSGLLSVRVVGNEVIVATGGEVRGYRGASREVK
jgi:outer membrane protein assembly factor BamB